MAQPAPTNAGPVGVADIFLSINGKKQGQIKGECRAKGHVDEISVVTWQWGLSSPTALGTTSASGRRTYEALVVTKHLDAATTKLMSALAQNEELKKVTLAARKAGSDGDDFFTIELETARITSSHVENDEHGGLHEVVKFIFQKVTVTYHPQLTGGGVGGAQVFTDEWSAAI